VADVAKMLKRPPQEVDAWESGESAPTYSQLEKLAYEIYKRPLAIFFLPSPPDEIPPKSEFRTLPDADMESLSRDTYLHIRRAHAFQFALKELFQDRNPISAPIWATMSISIDKSVSVQASLIREKIGITLDKQISWKNDEQALKEWRKSIEDTGVFIFKAAFKQKDISGFCLKDENFPIIYLNNSTAKTRQIFSLIHELSHLLLRISGLSKFDTSYVDKLPAPAKQIEQFCNAMAAEVLVPDADFSEQIRLFPLNVEVASESQFYDLAARYGVSREAILRRFLDKGRVSSAFYETKAKFWASQKQQSSGGNWYLNQGSYISSKFAKEIVSRHYQNQITLEQAADFLGIKPKNFPGFEERVLQEVEA